MTDKNKKNSLKDIVVESIKDRKGKDIIVLDLRKLEQSVADYFVICHGDSSTQVDAITENIDRETRTQLQEHPLHKEGTDNMQWVLLDYGDVVVHIFQDEYRGFYNLEDLWADAEKEVIKED